MFGRKRTEPSADDLDKAAEEEKTKAQTAVGTRCGVCHRMSADCICEKEAA